MSISKHFFILAASVALFSCSKMPEPTDNLGNPEFYLEGTINGSQIAINAGDEDYYMYTGTEKDAADITSIFGELSKSSCTNCAPSFKFEFRQQDSTGIIEPSEILKKGTANFWSSSYWEASFFPDVFGDNASSTYLWTFSDGTSLSEKYPKKRFLIEEDIFQQEVCLEVNGDKNICNSISLPNAHITANFSANRYYASFCKAIVECRASAQNHPQSNGAELQYHWESILGSLTVSERNITMVYPFNYPIPIDVIRLTVSDAHQNSASYSKYVVIDPLNAELTPNFNYEVKKIGTSDEKGYGTLVLKYTDSSGKQYSSKNAFDANAQNQFTILSVEEYLTNEKGQPTKKVTFEYTGKLYTAMGSDSVSVENLRGAIAVAY